MIEYKNYQMVQDTLHVSLKLVVSVTKELHHIYLQMQKIVLHICFKCFILCAKNHVFLGEYYFHGKLNILKLLFSVLFVTT